MRVVIAPDKFKGSLGAAEVAAAVAAGLVEGGVEADISCAPMADGGEGTVDAAVSAGYRPVAVDATGPLSNRVRATIAIDDDAGTAVIEMAAASGLAVLPTGGVRGRRQDALDATSRGTGELVRAALDAGCRRIVLGVGGSANTDGGAGMLAALGVRLLDREGAPIPDGGGGLSRLATADFSGLDPRLAEVELILASDVDNPLLGTSGAAAVFGPQKGVHADDVQLVDGNLARLVDALAAADGAAARTAASAPGAGAAGGVGYAALVIGGTRRPGIDVVMDLVGLRTLLTGADLVITGEGSLDSQSLGGKTPIGVAQLARREGVATVIAVCGRSALDQATASAAGFDRVYALTDIESDVSRCMAEADSLLRRIGTQIAAHVTAS